MTDQHHSAGGIDDEEEGGDHLCDEETGLSEHEVTADEELPAATGGVEE